MLESNPEEAEVLDDKEISDSENVPNHNTKSETPLNPEAPDYIPEYSRRLRPSAELLKTGGRIKVPVKVNNKIVVKALLDSGAEPSCVTQSLVEKLGIVPTSETTWEVQGIGENNVQEGREVSGVEVGLHGLKFKPNNFIVIQDAGTDFDIVLGLNFLINNGILLNPGERTIYHKENGIIDWLVEVAHDERCSWVLRQLVDCTVVADTKISGAKFSPVPITWSSMRENCDCSTCEQDCNFYFDGDTLIDNIEGETFSGIINKESYSVLLKLNVESKSMTLKSGQKLGNVYQLPPVALEALVGLQYIPEEDETHTDNWTLEKIKEVIQIGPKVSDEEKERIIKMMHEQSEVLCSSDSDIGRTSLTAHRIELYDYTPIRQRPRRLPEPIANAVEEQCEELYSLDIIEPSKSPWSAPIVPIRKKDGTIRLCVDYRKLNQITVPDRYPLPAIGDMISGLGGVKYFTTLDLVRGYYQMPVEETSREFTAFSTPRHHWQFKRLPFGLKNAPAAFQREMQAVLSGFSWKKVLVYIDDILIVEDSFEKHLDLVKKVLDTLNRHGVKIKPAKCSWFQSQVEFLGHQINQEGIKKTPSYISKLRDYERPKTVKEVREFLGLVNFQRKFMPRCSEIAKPLSKITGQDGKQLIEWTSEMTEAFESLKAIAIEDLELAYPEYGPQARPLELSVDASGYGAGACLSQWQGDVHRVIGYASMAFNETQQRYSTTDRELAALRWGVKTFKSYLYGTHFHIFTDHRPLIYLQNMKLIDSRIARTLEDLSDYSFEVYYRPGKENETADALSRIRPEIIEHYENESPGELPVGLKIINLTKGGGDSMFDSLTEVMSYIKFEEDEEPPPGDSLLLRKKLVQELQKDPKNYGIKTSRQINKELKLMERSGQFPFIECLLACSKLYDLQIRVHLGMEYSIIFDHNSGRNPDRNKRVHLQLLAGIHYNPVRELNSYHPEQDLNPERSFWKSGVKALKNTAESSSNKIVEGLLDVEHVDVQCTSACRLCSCGTPIWVGSQEFCVIPDTGSQISIISKPAWEALPLSRKDDGCLIPIPDITIRGIGGQLSPIIGVAKIIVKIDEEDDFKTFPFAVVEEGVIPGCILIGANFMVENRLVMDFQRQVVTYKGRTLYDFSHAKYRLGLLMCAPSEIDEILSPVPEGVLYHYGHTVPLDRIVDLQKKDFVLKRIRNIVTSGFNRYPKRKFGWYKLFKRFLPYLSVYADCLWYKDPNTTKAIPVINRKFLQDVVYRTHQSMAHVGEGKLRDVIISEFWHPSINQVCREVATCCPWCQKNKPGSAGASPPCLKIESSSPFELVAVDLVELPRTARGYVGCFVMVDHYSKWLSVVPIKNKKAETVSAALESQVLPKLPLVPTRLLSDNGPEFRSEVFNELLDSYNIKHTYTTPYKPSSNGAVERVNRSVIQLLKGLANDPTDWDMKLGKAVVVYNNTWHEEIKNTPGKFLLERSHVASNRPLIHKDESAKWKEGNPNFVSFSRDDLVLKRIERQGRLNVHKLSEKFDGPFRVNRVFDNGVTYELVDESSNVIRAHHSQLRKWKTPPAYMQESVPELPSSDSWRACRECARLCGDQRTVTKSNDYAGSIPVLSFGLTGLGVGLGKNDMSEDDCNDSVERRKPEHPYKKSFFEFFRRSRDKSKVETDDSWTDLRRSDSDPYSYDYTYDLSDSISDPYTYDYTYDSFESDQTYDPITEYSVEVSGNFSDVSVSSYGGDDVLVCDGALRPSNMNLPDASASPHDGEDVLVCDDALRPLNGNLLDTRASPYDGDVVFVDDDALCPATGVGTRTDVLNSTSLGAVPDFGSGLSRIEKDSSSSSSVHHYDVMEESLDILSEMNRVVDFQEDFNVSVLEKSMDLGADPALELYRKSRETISEAIGVLTQQLKLKKQLALQFESKVERLRESMGVEFLGFSSTNNSNVEPSLVVDSFSGGLENIDVPEELNSGNNTILDEYFMGARADDGVRASTPAGESMNASRTCESSLHVTNTSYKEVTSERLEESIVMNGTLVRRTATIVVEKELVRPVDTGNGPATRSHGRVLDLPRVMKAPIEFKRNRLP